MKIIEPSVKLIDFVDTDETMRKLELCGRVSHQSQPRVDSADNFVRNLIKRGHESVLEHVSLTFHIVCDRAIMAELTRHRHCAFTVESTRYVKYDKLEAVNPFIGNDFAEAHWVQMMIAAEKNYRLFVDVGVKPEEARAVLPLCLKTELYMTANLREWRHILKLRTANATHPQMRFIAGKILDIIRDKLPVIVEDIGNE